MEKIPVAVVGATGTVGRRLVVMLASHPWFEIIALAASERSVGKEYRELAEGMLPERVAAMRLHSSNDLPREARLVFSTVRAEAATTLEAQYAVEGRIVVSNARSHRMRPEVPIIVGEVNRGHLVLMQEQKRMGGGAIVTNPNCVVAGVSLALKPLDEAFGLEAVTIVTMQALSGAGYPGVPSIDIIDNVIPSIVGEEQKIEAELKKVLGVAAEGKIIPSDIITSAQCHRVNVSDGHLAAVAVKFKQKPSLASIRKAWEEFPGLGLPSAPKNPVEYAEGIAPQPRRHRNAGKGMTVTVGQLRPCSVLDYKFTLLSHNTVRGAAGNAVLTAEILAERGVIAYVPWIAP